MADTATNPRQTVTEIVGRPLKLYHGLRGKARRARVADILEQIETGAGFEDRYPAAISGGQKQRVAIARALAAEPDFIVCAEPTSALDPLVADGIRSPLLRLQRERGIAYVFITRDIAIVRAIADPVCAMLNGRVQRFGPRSEALLLPFDDCTDLQLRSVPEMRVGRLEQVLDTRRRTSAGH